MPEDDDSEGLVSKFELERLAGLWDRWMYALDPSSMDAEEAVQEFYDSVDRLYETHVSRNPDYEGLGFEMFEGHVSTLCRAYCKKNPR